MLVSAYSSHIGRQDEFFETIIGQPLYLRNFHIDTLYNSPNLDSKKTAESLARNLFSAMAFPEQYKKFLFEKSAHRKKQADDKAKKEVRK